jgi:hypothetical protein
MAYDDCPFFCPVIGIVDSHQTSSRLYYKLVKARYAHVSTEEYGVIGESDQVGR